MPEANDWNSKIIAGFRAGGGRVGGNFEGAPVALVHHRGRRSGREYVTPLMYLPDDADDDATTCSRPRAGHRRTPTGTTTSPPSARAPSSAAPRRTP